MKLLNQSLLYLTVPIFVIISLWAVVFYHNMFTEIYDSIDDGLDNYKMLIVEKAQRDSSVFANTEFDESNYSIRQIDPTVALQATDVFSDTLMYMLNENEMEPVRMLTTAFSLGDNLYELKVISSMVEEDDQIENLTRSAVLLYILLLLSILFVNNFMLRKLWMPFYQLLHQLKNFRIDKNKVAPQILTNTKEFQELQKATSTLINQSVQIFDKQKQFTENAAHELQTPLAVITNKLELLLERCHLTDEDAAAVAQVLQTTNRLKRYNKSLLLLSKIENKQFFDNQLLIINDLVQQQVEELSDFADFKKVDITIESAEKVIVEVDAHLANILIGNLIKNAIFHNIKKGRVTISLMNQILQVRNTSHSLSLDTTKIFNRYYHAQQADKRRSSGLGLPIVQAISQLYGFDLKYEFIDGEHVFWLKF